jgi:hypothetical protein
MAPLDEAASSAADVWTMPLDRIDVSDPRLYQDDIYYPYFARLRRDDPVHYCPASHYGPYWSVTKYRDIMQVEINHQIYSDRGPRPAKGAGAAELYRDGPAQARRATHGGQPSGRAR